VSFGAVDLSDGELAALTVAGRQDAFAEIMRRHREPIFRLIRGHVGNEEDALDLVQDCFVAAYRNLDRYDGERPLRAWLSRIAINKCRDFGRRRAVRRLFSSSAPWDSAASEVPDPAPPADDVAADRQELESLWRAVSALPGKLKEPLILRAIEGLSQAEAADVLGISEKAVETRLYRARKKLSGFSARGTQP
jgi:RNA polymerase sigma factor CnrH